MSFSLGFRAVGGIHGEFVFRSRNPKPYKVQLRAARNREPPFRDPRNPGGCGLLGSLLCRNTRMSYSLNSLKGVYIGII